MQTETKVSVIVAVALVLTALYDLRISAAFAAVYLLVNGVYRLRKRRKA